MRLYAHVALLCLSLACVPSQAGKGPLTFEQIEYSGPSGAPWPNGKVPLPKAAEAYALAKVPELYYVELNPTGEPTLLFIHGLGSYLKFWRYQLDAFAAQGYRVVAIDMIGFGKSDKPATFPYTMEAMADVAREAAQALGVERPILVGHSMGGQTAMAYAINYPDEVRALVLTAPAGFEKFSEREKSWFRASFSSALVKGTPEEGIWGSVRKNNFYEWRDEYAWLIEERVRLVGDESFDSYAYANVRSVQGLTQTDSIRDNLGKIAAPTLIVFGHKDRLIPNPFLHGGKTEDVMQFGASRIRGSKLVGLDRCGHMVQMDCSAEYNREVAGFLEQVKKAPPPEPDPEQLTRELAPPRNKKRR